MSMSVGQMCGVVAHRKMRGGVAPAEYHDVGIGPDISTYSEKTKLVRVDVCNSVQRY